MKDRITPENIQSLKENEIIVFGSNVGGQHHGGLARRCYDKFGAEWGHGKGFTGQCYAIPTMGVGVENIVVYVGAFINNANKNKDLTFLVTAIGTGIAGYAHEEIAPLFKNAINVENIHLPESFWKILNK